MKDTLQDRRAWRALRRPAPPSKADALDAAFGALEAQLPPADWIERGERRFMCFDHFRRMGHPDNWLRVDDFSPGARAAFVACFAAWCEAGRPGK